VKKRGLTIIPVVNAPNALITESYGKDERVVLKLWGTKLPDRC
jgi:hypothetical protein